MKKFVRHFFFAVYISTVLFTGVVFAETNCSGWQYYDYDLNTCVTCENTGFTITTTELQNDTNFLFSLSAKGYFVVDWDDANTEIQHINRDDTTATEYSHTYQSGGEKHIKFCGRATGYNTAVADNVVAAISFYKATGGTQTNIASVSGSLGSVFPTLSNTAAGQPRFRSTFQEAANLKTIPANLFDGVYGSADGMFRSTFDKCTILEEIPYGLFANVTGGAPNMFRSTFYQCKAIPSIPDNLFAGITDAAKDQFRFTFFEATGLTGTYIPPTAFKGLVDANAPQPTSGNMWYQTFTKSGLLQECPERTRQFMTGYEGTVANSTWVGFVSCEPGNPCTGATYWDSTTEDCVPCPAGYDDDIKDTKISINECKIQCDAGTYLANVGDATCTNAGNGYYATGGLLSFGSTSSRVKCPDDMPTINNTTTASDVSQCVVYCRGINYRDETTNSCVACPTGYDDDRQDGKMADSDCKIRCEAGTYLPTPYASACINVGDGYWAEETAVAYGSTTTPGQCPNGQMTGMVNASSSSQCIELCNGATYHDSTTGTCEPCPVGYNAHILSGKMSINECQIHCVAGTYIANEYDTVCSNVGDGFYASASNVNYGSTSSRGQCPAGQMTGTQTATSLSQCKTSCQGARYYKSATDSCENCPTGFTDNVTDGKNSINQCQGFCAGGTYMETYTPLLYLQGNGTNQYIDTLYAIKNTHVHGTVVVGTPTTLSGGNADAGNFFGNLYGPGGFSANWKKGAFGVWVQNIKKSGQKSTFNTTFNANQQYTIDFDVIVNSSKKGTAQLWVDGQASVAKGDNNVSINDEGNSFKLFSNGGATRNGNTVVGNQWGDKLFSGRIYSLQLYDGDTLALDIIPVRRESDGAIGMFNRVTNEFYGNAGLGTFTTGADNGDSFTLCAKVGNGYYVGDNYTNFGEYGTRNQCPNDASTILNDKIINNATSIYQCEGVVPCTGAKYPDPDTGICTFCPTGYDYNTLNGKESIYECQTHCYAGTYLANPEDATCTNVGDGYWADEDTINWGDFGMRTRCSNGGVTNTETATSEAQCVAIDACTGATYMNSGRCEPCPTGYTANETDGKTDISACQIICPEGSYLATVNGTTCIDAGVGFWATGGAVNYGETSTKNTCPDGLTTVGYGHGADELADCGRKLHIGNYVLYTKTTKPTTPAINIRPANDSSVYYVGVSNTEHTLTPVHITSGNTQYTAFDDSILHGERDFQTNTRITQ
jgi:hypothetical protein